MIAIPGVDASLDSAEAAAFLGMCPDELQKLARRGTLPAFKQGREWRFLASDLTEYMRQWRYSSEVKSGGLTSTTKASASGAAPARKTAGRPKQHMTHLQRTATAARVVNIGSRTRSAFGSKTDPETPEA